MKIVGTFEVLSWENKYLVYSRLFSKCLQFNKWNEIRQVRHS